MGSIFFLSSLFLALVPQDVLVIVADDVGWPERASLTALDQVAARGMTFERAYSFSVCSPTRYAALTGRYPRSAGIGDVINAHDSDTGASPPPNRLDIMLPEALKPSHETALIGKWHLGRASLGSRQDLLALTESGPFVSGFDSWRAGSPNSIALGPGSTGYYDWYRVDNGQVRQNATVYATHAQRDAFVSWWSSTRGRKFAWLAFNSAHQPFDPPPGTVSTGTTRGDYELLVADLNAAIATVLASVDLNNTYVVFFCDNGTPDEARPTGSPSGVWKGTCFEGGIRIPLIVSGPRIRHGVSHRLVSALDISPTLLELLKVDSRGFQDGRSFANELGAWTGDLARTFVFSERYDTPSTNPSVGYDDQAVIEQSWKLRRVDSDGPGPIPVRLSAYHLPSDPLEQRPIDPAQLPIALASRLMEEMTSIPPRLE